MKKKQENVIAVIVSVILSFLFLFESPLHPWNCYDVTTDSGVFKTISMMMGKGYMPYRDSFDHKGPLLYLINWLGDCFSPYRGVWLIEFVFMTVTVFMLYKIARLSCNLWEALIAALISLTLLYTYFEGGNLVEEYAMCFISISLFIFIDYLKNDKVTAVRLVICGAALAGTLLLRPNMIAVWIVMCLTILAKTLLAKDWKSLRTFILFFCIGILAVSVPVLLWLAIKGDFSYFWDAYIVFNFEYTARTSLANRWSAFFIFLNKPICYIALFAQIYFLKLENKWLNRSYLLCMLLTLMLISCSGETYSHYGMILIPLIAYPVSCIFEQLGRWEGDRPLRMVSMLACLYFLVALVMPCWEATLREFVGKYDSRNNGKISMTAGTVANLVEDYTTEDDCISVYGNWDLIYVLSQRKHATRYSYQFPIGAVRPQIMEEYLTQLEEEQPKVIVVQPGHVDDTILGFLRENDYELLWPEPGEDMNEALVYVLQ